MITENAKSTPGLLPSDFSVGPIRPLSGSEKVIEQAIQDRLRANLRRLYAELLEQPVPEHFLELVRRWDEGQETSG